MSGVLAIIGGSGLYDVESLEDVEERWVSTPYGAPSDAVIRGRMKGTDTTVLFLRGTGAGTASPERDQLPREPLRAQAARRDPRALGQRRRSMKEEIARGISWSSISSSI